MTIRKKLLLGFVGSTILVGVVGVCSMCSLAATANSLRGVVDTSLSEVADTNELSRTVVAMQYDMDAIQNSFADGHAPDVSASAAKIDQGFVRLFTPLRRLRAESQRTLRLANGKQEQSDEQQHIARLENLETLAREWQTEWEALAAFIAAHGTFNDALDRRSDEASLRMWKAALDLQEESSGEIHETLTDGITAAHSEQMLILCVTAIAAGLAGGIAIFTAGPLARRFKDLNARAAIFGAGNLAMRFSEKGRDEIAALSATFNIVAESLAASQNELVLAARRAEAASRSKSAFLANMSHEIRTPMTAIMGYSELLLDPSQPISERHESLQVIRRSSHHLLELINDVLDLSKIEADKMTADRVKMNLPQVTADVVSLMRARAVSKGLSFRLTFDDAIPKFIHSDPLRLKQVLMNILGNALKFTEHGEIRIHLAWKPTETSSIITFDVSDTGIGMSPEQVARLFQPFTQADDSMTRRFGGTGLGLAISKRLVELLGGSLLVQSLAGVGSKFLITIDGGIIDPATLQNGLTESMLGPIAGVEAPAKKITLAGRVLLAEDGPDNQRLISLNLRKAGAEVVIAENGRIAVELARKQPFDLILMDMQMPELDGYAATGELRSGGCTLPIIALTAHAMADDRARCMAAGCTDYLTKPIAKETLLSVLAGFLQGSTAVDSPAPALAAPAAPASDPATGLRSTLANDPDMTDAISEFVADLPPRVAEMANLLEQNKLPELQRFVHQLKGAGGGYGFDKITRMAATVETALRQNDSLQMIQREIDALVALVRSVEGYQSAKEHTVQKALANAQ